MPDRDIHMLPHEEFGNLSAELIENTGGLRFRAHGRSMRPSIRGGDVLTLEKTDPASLAIGDIVLVRNRTGSLLAHRVIRRGPDNWTTCGDALFVPDVPFEAGQLIGRVSSVEHKGRDRRPSASWGRFMAALSRQGRSLPGRVLKRVLRAL